VRNATYRNNADVSDALASKDLKELVDAGLLVPHGERRGRYYTAGPATEALSSELPGPQRPGDPFEEIDAPQQELF
jgi:hypothetical protein